MTNTTTDNPPTIDAILRRLRDGQLDLADARHQIDALVAQPLGYATLDHDRARRCGVPEVVFAAGKTAEHLVGIVRELRRRQPCVLITRLNADHRAALHAAFADDLAPHDGPADAATAIVGQPASLDLPAIPIVTAGTSDAPVAHEAVMTCHALGHPALEINDVGVAGLHRLGQRLESLRAANVIVCITGMEGALPSVVGGLVDRPVIAVPTSVGYGAAFAGLTALLGMLTSCASGVSVVNIDNGFGAAYNA
ncbi:MAG: nickel pincer cofactor biosynthesis protein LarB, partial [Phycisphaeraceae bacterium]